jgi:plasmid replication initiation protein
MTDMEPITYSKDETQQRNSITPEVYDEYCCQRDILIMLIRLIKKDDPTGKSYDIHFDDLETIRGRRWNKKQLQEATCNLGSRMHEIETEETYIQFWTFSKVTYYEGSDLFSINLNEDARLLLLNLKEKYTALQLEAIIETKKLLPKGKKEKGKKSF